MATHTTVEVGDTCMYFGFVLLRKMQSWGLLLSGGRRNIVKDAIPIDSLPDRADAQAGLQHRK